MDVNGQRTSFPRISANHWWALRERFRITVPKSVEDTYLATLLGGMSAKSARANVMAPLRIMGLIDKDNAPTELARQWRLDEQYPGVCKRIVESVYPNSLLDAVPMETPRVDAAKSWFMDVARVGDAAAGSMARTYVLLCEADVAKRSEPKAAATRSSRKGSASPRTENRAVTSSGSASDDSELDVRSNGETPFGEGFTTPSLHIDVQIHIHAESSEKQIDAIFASMAKHLYPDSRANGS